MSTQFEVVPGMKFSQMLAWKYPEVMSSFSTGLRGASHPGSSRKQNQTLQKCCRLKAGSTLFCRGLFQSSPAPGGGTTGTG